VLSWLDRQVFECSPHLLTVVVSRKVEEDFQKTYPKVRFQFRRLYNAVDLEDFHDRDREQRRSEIADRLQLPAGGRLALFVGHNFRLKGLRHAVSAVARTTNWHLLVAGGGADVVYRRQARLAGVERRVHFVGPQKRLRELYAASDAALLPTYYDTCSLATLESAACGLPAVTTRLNGASELIMPSDAGIVVDHPRQEDLLAHALTEVDLHWLRYHENALALRPDLCWKRHMDRFEEILAESLAVR
jgi:UDP-glucose:(heptosyl)LPS alpha-1,3-glucosyltransferase